jgi:hypothetical protein
MHYNPTQVHIIRNLFTAVDIFFLSLLSLSLFCLTSFDLTQKTNDQSVEPVFTTFDRQKKN